MKYLITLVTAVVLGLAGPGANAAPPVSEDDGHPHHVHTGNGGCVDVDAVKFLAVDRGLHQGAARSDGMGPDHGSCHSA